MRRPKAINYITFSQPQSILSWCHAVCCMLRKMKHYLVLMIIWQGLMLMSTGKKAYIWNRAKVQKTLPALSLLSTAKSAKMIRPSNSKLANGWFGPYPDVTQIVRILLLSRLKGHSFYLSRSIFRNNNRWDSIFLPLPPQTIVTTAFGDGTNMEESKGIST